MVAAYSFLQLGQVILFSFLGFCYCLCVKYVVALLNARSKSPPHSSKIAFRASVSSPADSQMFVNSVIESSSGWTFNASGFAAEVHDDCIFKKSIETNDRHLEPQGPILWAQPARDKSGEYAFSFCKSPRGHTLPRGWHFRNVQGDVP